MKLSTPTLRLLIFIGILIGLNFGITAFMSHFIFWSGVFSSTQKTLIWTGIFSIIPLYILTESLKRTLGWARLHVVSSILLGTFSIAVGMALLGTVLQLLGIIGPTSVFPILLSIPILSFIGITTYVKGPKIRTITLQNTPRFSKLETRYTVVHLSDIHLTATTRPEWLHNIVNKVNALKPDFILFTGDLLDVQPEKIPHLISILGQLQASQGKFAVSGNHDFMTGIDAFSSVCHQTGFRVLNNQKFQQNGLVFAGVPDEMAASYGEKGPSLDCLMDLNPDAAPIIFLKHRPTHFKHAAKLGVALQLSGHSHNGQLPPWGLLVKLRYSKYAYGLHRLKNSFIYTSCGTGVWGPPMRLFQRSEIVVFQI
jgi:predicted MPP superfamily phosphohydrolase